MSWKKWHKIFLEEMMEPLKSAPNVSPVHKGGHVMRVWKKSMVLCERLGGDMEIMAAAVLLHGLGMHHGLEIHGGKSAELAKPMLEKHGFPKEKMPKVIEAIAQHDYNFPSRKRKLLEAKILYDADKMDAFGPAGVYRRTVFYMEKKKKRPGEILKLLGRRWNGLMLPESRKVAKEDYGYIVKFFENLKLFENLKHGLGVEIK